MALDRSRFSTYFGVNEDIIREYGAVNISLLIDTPLFIDPMLIFNSEKPEYKELHNNIIKFFHFLARQAKELPYERCKQWLLFPEIPNNWLGFSIAGNKGLALGEKYANFLYRNLEFIFSDDGITTGTHFEKVMLLFDGEGKDKISDLTMHLILDYVCSYTEQFALQHISEEKRSKFRIDGATFNYQTKSFVPKSYVLPFIYNEKSIREFVLLTPIDILRADDITLNRKDMFLHIDDIVATIENPYLRNLINNYIISAVQEYEEECQRNRKKPSEKEECKIKKEVFEAMLKEYPILYSYYIKLKENWDKTEQFEQAEEEVKDIMESFDRVPVISNSFPPYSNQEKMDSVDEAQARIRYFKHCLEDCDGYKIFYDSKGEPVRSEAKMQRLFKFVWYGAFHTLSSETNNGRGPADFVVSTNANDKCVIEFKLASNSKLNHVFSQIGIYGKAHETNKAICVIFYFDGDEYLRAYNMIKDFGKLNDLDKDVFLIDCCAKESASNVK